MKHYFIKRGLLVAALAAGLLSGCQKEKEEFVTLGVRAESVGGSGSKVIIGTGSTNKPQPQWEANSTEAVKINAETKTVSGTAQSPCLAEVTAANTYRAVYPASIVTTTDLTSSATVSVTLPGEQTYKEDASGRQQVEIPMGAYLGESDFGAGNTTLQFKNLCSLVKVRVTNSQGVDLVITSLALEANNAGLCGAGTVTIDGASDPYVTLNDQSSKRIELSMGDDGVTLDNGDSKDFYFVVPVIDNAHQSTMTMSVTALNTDGTLSYSFEKSTGMAVSLARNTEASVSLTIQGVTPQSLSTFVAVPGVFAVSATKKVKFAQGNLVYTESTSSFSFEANQYDYRETHDGDVWGHFGWSTNSTYGVNTSNNNDDYSGDFKDWGKAIGDGNTWRTLSNDEWGYLFNNRTGATIDGTPGRRYAYAIVAGVNGIILFPDFKGDGTSPFEWPQNITAPSTYNDFVDEWSGAPTYSAAQWTTLETAGCVFLPAAGMRRGTSVNSAGSNGDYWSSTPSSVSKAYLLYFYGTRVEPQGNTSRYQGFSVRLVQNAN